MCRAFDSPINNNNNNNNNNYYYSYKIVQYLTLFFLPILK